MIAYINYLDACLNLDFWTWGLDSKPQTYQFDLSVIEPSDAQFKQAL